MDLLLCGDFLPGERAAWQQALSAALPRDTIWPERPADAAQRIEVALVANPPVGALQGLPRLRLIQSLWAGVDRVLADATLPPQVPLARMVDPAMADAMAETALWATLALQRGFFRYAQQQRDIRWQVHAQRAAGDVPVAVLGRGQMGRAVAARLSANGFPVASWGRTPAASAITASSAPLASVRPTAQPASLPSMGDTAAAHGDAALLPLLARSQIVINLLPLTPATRGLLNQRCFAAMPPGAALVNLGRGAHVVDADLLAALDRGHLAHAVLDVFQIEPLPPGHRYWSHPAVTVLPHAAALTDPRSAAAVVATQVDALRAGRPLQHTVDRQRGY